MAAYWLWRYVRGNERAEKAAQIVGAALGSGDEFILNTFIALGQLSPAEWELIKKFVDKIKGDDEKSS